MHSIRVRITAIAIAAILLSMLTLMAVCYFNFQSVTEKRTVETMNLISRNAQKSIEKYLQSLEQSVEMAANLAADSLDSVALVENGVAGTGADPSARTAEQTEAMDAYLSLYFGRIQEAFASVATHTQGVVTYYYFVEPDISREELGFFYSRVGKTGFEKQPPVDVSLLDSADAEHTAWYFLTLQRGRPSWVGPYSAHFLGELRTCSYLVPIYKAGKLIGVLGMDIPFETLVDQVRSIQVYDTGFAFLTDEDGSVLWHPQLPYGSHPEDVSTAGLHDALRQNESSGDHLFVYTADGEERQLAFATLQNGMKLVVTAPTREINASAIRLSRIILVVTCVAVIICAVLLMLAMRLMIRPLGRLTAASTRLAAGDFDAELDYSGRDEIGALTASFKQMRDQQKRYIDDLNYRIDTDPLTDLPNMRAFFRAAEEKRLQIRQAGGIPAMLYFNLLGMKHFNHQYGFEAGDRLLRDFAGILVALFERQHLCRFSEDHFAAIAEEKDAEEKIRAVFAECEKLNGGHSLPVSVGVYPDRLEEVSASVACDRARFAMDRRRGSTTSGLCVYDREMLRREENYRYIMNNLDRALSEGWIQVYYQAIIRAADGKVCDEEALSRWIDPSLGFLSPAEFIPALEESRLIYKLDLHVVDQVLLKLKRQAEAGMYVVPQSVNLSRIDFDSCDIVEEIRRRVDSAGIDRSMLSIEITESVVGSDFEFMKQQIERFQALGFPVWMDDFGSGYSSLDVLQNIHFDLIKFDMRFMSHFSDGDESKVILTELTRMAIALGVETVCEGVEQKEQVEFLQEIGCTKIQGYYYGKPLPFEEILHKFSEGVDMGFENPEEATYFEAIGRINLYDMAVLSEDNDESLRRYFDTLPMSIMEVTGTRVKYNRCNKGYREFLKRTLGLDFSTEERDFEAMPQVPGYALMAAVIRCAKDGNRAFVDERINPTLTTHVFLRRVAVNPVSGAAAVAIAVLAVIREDENVPMDYVRIAKALFADYIYLYEVDLDSGRYTEYTPDPRREDLAEERRGENFFSDTRRDAKSRLYPEDQEPFISSFCRENIIKALDTQGAFTLTYRLMIGERPTYVQLKAVRVRADSAHIVIGISNVDAYMRKQEALSRGTGD